jgi:hypothetical protein
MNSSDSKQAANSTASTESSIKVAAHHKTADSLFTTGRFNETFARTKSTGTTAPWVVVVRHTQCYEDC